jgi:hypothetical protein
VAAIDILKTVGQWAKNAFGFITGSGGNPLNALLGLWRYITSVHNVLAWLVGGPQLKFVIAALYNMSVLHLAVDAVSGALHLLARWILATWILPIRDDLIRRIAALRAWAVLTFQLTRALIELRYQAALAYTRALVGAERDQRLKGDQLEHAAMLHEVAAALATVQRQAVSGYDSTLHERLGIVGKILDELAVHDPLVKQVVRDMVTAIFDLETIDNPVLRFTIGHLLNTLIAKLSVDKVIADLVSRLLGSLTGHGRPQGLQDVTRDIGQRLNALEDQWADFMKHGGADVEQAGDEWAKLATLAVDVGILGMFGLAVANPQAWATGVADTIGVAGNDTLISVINLVRKA